MRDMCHPIVGGAEAGFVPGEAVALAHEMVSRMESIPALAAAKILLEVPQ